MEIILLEKVQNVGDLGDLVNVKNGYARNFLIPQKKAVRATEDAKEKVEERRRALAEEDSRRVEAAKARAELAIREISVTRLCGEEGKLYGSVTVADVAETLTEAGTRIEKSEVSMPDGPIKNVGEFQAEIILHPEVRFSVNITVQGDQDSVASEEADAEEVDSESETTSDEQI